MRTLVWPRIAKRIQIIIMLCFVIAAYVQGRSIEINQLSIQFTMDRDAFPLVTENGASNIVYSDGEDSGIIRAIVNLQQDIARVSSKTPNLIQNTLSSQSPEVIVGSLGDDLIEQFIAKNKIDVSGIRGKWEAFMITTVTNEKGTKNLLIVGNDKRGTIFGIYDLSSKIGVSPWYWWADVPVKHHNEIYVRPSTFKDAPKVKYRGIFLNDEAPALTGWANEKFGGFNHKFYEHVFELILRLKGNFLWPAMWGSAFYDDDPLNPILADQYGVVIGTSHHEPLMRAHAEWAKYGEGAWDYEKNPENLRKFWRESIQKRKDYEAVITVGMRGDGDMAMTEGTAIDLLETIISDQRKILEEEFGKDPSTIPQVWALYKEVQDYYNKGMVVPEDITLLLCDDNWGNVRVLPKPGSPERSGGYGMYYHFDFVGGPVSYRWLNVTPLARTWEQLNMTYQHGVDRLWVVNVGDLKPMEFPISFFLDQAWDPDAMTAEKMGEYTEHWVKENFGDEYSSEISKLLEGYTRFNYRRTPEMLSPDTYSLKNYREFETVVKEYNNLLKKAKEIDSKLPDEYHSAFYQLVMHPIEACANLNEMYYVTGLNRLYASQGRASTNSAAGKVRKLFKRDSLITEYYNKELADGKWDHFMDQTHIGYRSWNNPPVNFMPKVSEIEVPDKGSLGVMPEGTLEWWPDAEGNAVLPEFDNLNDQHYYLELFNRGIEPVAYKLKTEDPWVILSESNGKLDSDRRILVSIDWAKAPVGKSSSGVMLSTDTGEDITVGIVAVKHPESQFKDFKGFVEANGYISIEAEHFTREVHDQSMVWKKIPEFGRTLSGMTVLPTTHAPVMPESDDSPHLEYNVYLNQPGEVKVKAYIAPTLNIYNDEGMKYAVSFDDQNPVIYKIHEFDTIPDWEYPQWWNESVTNNIRVVETDHTIDKAGPHTLKIWMVTPGVVFEKIVIETDEIGDSYLGPPESYRKE